MNSLIAFTTNPSIGPALSILSSSVSSLYKSYLNHSTSLFASLASQYQFLQPFKPFFRRFLVLSSVPLAVFVIASVCSTVISVVVGLIAAVTFSVFWILGSCNAFPLFVTSHHRRFNSCFSCALPILQGICALNQTLPPRRINCRQFPL
ncbi:hypothetical protein BKA69DRAFT_751466 [Paraphysoderma sedebokerense]|nr:hypothetical protein BKA69DRAFT_751466 [Paraphysoderma sedebokerense]